MLTRISNFFAGDSVLTVMARHRGAGPGFDWVRIGLSLCVILLHSIHTSYGYRPGASLANGPSGPLFAAILPMFFGLSGFLVAGSAIRTRNLKVFLTFRVLRIMPALVTEVTLSALVLGTLLTTYPLRDYFSDPRFLTYFGNIIGWVHFYLPGVFEQNPRPGIVNQNLWTLHPELISYAVMAGMIVSAVVYSRPAITIMWAMATVVLFIVNIFTGMFEPHGVYPGKILVYFFVTGVVLYHWRDKIVVNGALALLCVVIAYILYWFPNTTFIIQFPLMYLMLWLGMQAFPRIGWLQSGDYSYGLYLYAYPVQQTLVMLFVWSREWYINFALTVPITLGIAMLSWHFVEKPALSLKRYVTAPKVNVPPLA
jgi:peptidoglycan/LPS O-acetylase OafA/YrhL